jgi:hypothetical protein
MAQLPTDVLYAAALAEMVYRRDPRDQAPELGGGGIEGVDLDIPVEPSGLTLVDGYYYDDDTGFVARVVVNDKTDTVFVVFRGTDLGDALALNLDTKDWVDANIPLAVGSDSSFIPSLQDGGQGTSDVTFEDSGAKAVTQFDDALRLTLAAQAAAGGRKVVVVGQSLGGGLAGLVSATLGLKAYMIAPAPYDNELTRLATIAAFRDNGLGNLSIPQTSLGFDLDDDALRAWYAENVGVDPADLAKLDDIIAERHDVLRAE